MITYEQESTLRNICAMRHISYLSKASAIVIAALPAFHREDIHCTIINTLPSYRLLANTMGITNGEGPDNEYHCTSYHQRALGLSRLINSVSEPFRI